MNSPYTLFRDKEKGTAAIVYDVRGTGTYQGADVLGRAAFHVPAVFTGSKVVGNNVYRSYEVTDWNEA